MSKVLYDTDFNTASATGTPRYSAPFDGTNIEYVLEQDYVQRVGYFTPQALSTPSDIDSSFLLVKESPLQPVNVADVVKWTRTYAKVPATRNDYSTTAYQFIGFTGYIAVFIGVSTTTVPGRARFSKSVTARVQYDYFLVGSTTYPTVASIPTIQAQKYYFRIGTLIESSGSYTWTAKYALGSSDDINQGIPTDYITDDTSISTSSFQYGVIPSVPTRSTYMGWITNKTEIVAEDSQVTRWMGNIYVRSTKYIIAQ